ncbi:beta-D-glucosyl crocetin beta-1,6-glucosyltransferase-like [Populus alba]|uniref:beta-D-glucosyl crocetin beta-1,6-glucosyltransferase-like n=1 Tax=Populus alba TaxID=43335 RepID=UPI0015883C77|nr:flavanone 7-O-glucoside 2''-O-beta-L-rhamnosyltransferase-like [Populus alba]
MQAFDKASRGFSNILTALKPDLLICDFFQPWALALALSLNIPTVQFVISTWQRGKFCRSSCPQELIEQSYSTMLVRSSEEIDGRFLDDLSAVAMKTTVLVLRFAQGEEISAKEALPEGFFDMIGERGLIVEEWAPQKRISSHPGTGGFLSHVEVGAGLEIKGDKNGMLQRQEVPKVIKDAVEEKTGQHLRRKAG